jgi:hypothetical protein
VTWKGLFLSLSRHLDNGGQVAGKYLALEELYHAAHNILRRQYLELFSGTLNFYPSEPHVPLHCLQIFPATNLHYDNGCDVIAQELGREARTKSVKFNRGKADAFTKLAKHSRRLYTLPSDHARICSAWYDCP